MQARERRLRLDKHEGWIGGVCAGIARYLGFETLYVRIAAIALTVVATKLTAGAYLIAWLILDDRERNR